jgi:uncharacterized protein (TIGR03000 family)
MYSIVLMMSLTQGTADWNDAMVENESPLKASTELNRGFRRRGCCGCSGGYSYGGYGGCYGGYGGYGGYGCAGGYGGAWGGRAGVYGGGMYYGATSYPGSWAGYNQPYITGYGEGYRPSGAQGQQYGTERRDLPGRSEDATERREGQPATPAPERAPEVVPPAKGTDTPATPGTPAEPKTPKPADDKKSGLDSSTAPATVIVRLPANARLTIDGQATRSTSGVRTFVSPPLTMGKDYQYILKAEGMDGRSETRTIDVRAGKITQVTFGLASFRTASK